MEYSSRICIRVKDPEIWKKLYGMNLEPYWISVSADSLFRGLKNEYLIDSEWGCPPEKLESFVKEITKKLNGDCLIIADNYCLSVDPYTYTYLSLGGKTYSFHFEWPYSRDDPKGEMWGLSKNVEISDLDGYLGYQNFFRFNEDQRKILEEYGLRITEKELAAVAETEAKYSALLSNPKEYEHYKKLSEEALDIENGTVLGFKPGKTATILIIPEGVKRIEKDAFQWQESVKAVILPESLEEISQSAFYSTKTEYVKFSSNLKSIGRNAFGGCDLKKVCIPDSVNEVEDGMFSCNYNLKIVDLHEGITRIGNSVFSSCAFSAIDLPNSLTELGAAFGCCNQLQTITLPPNLETVGSRAFRYCAGLKSVVMPPSVKYIYAEAFQDCKRLKLVTVCDGLEIIGKSAFSGCAELEDIRIPDTVTLIEDEAFRGVAVRRMTIPASVHVIPNKMMLECKHLEEVVIEGDITKIGGRVFAKCPSLKSVYIKGELGPKCGKKIFDQSPNVIVYGIPGSKAEELAHDENVAFSPLEGASITNSNTEPKIEEKVQCSFCDKKIIIKNTVKKRSPDGSICVVCKKCYKAYNLSEWETILDA